MAAHKDLFLLLFHLSLFLIGITGASLQYVTVGGIFNALSDNSEKAYEQSQYLASFLLAIEHLNNKTDGILDEYLPDTHIDVVVRHTDSASEAASAAVSFSDVKCHRGSTGVDAVISTIAS